jgi:sugar/nucleoside kinase (ribokinase family)
MINFCRSGLEAIVGQGLDYLFCNQEEAAMWCASQDLQVLARRLGELARVVCLTRGALGCLVLDRDKSTQSAVPAAAVKALDTNGAGDMFAGAFLYAVTQGYSLLQAAWLGNQAAALVVSQFGTRLNQRAMAQLKAQFDRHVQT